MTPQLYQQNRDELLGLLSQCTSLNIPQPHMSELLAVQKKCQENQFEIALVGEFQGGKSTTFNALCDGREISPRGLNGGGVKTSAGIITAQYLSDPNEEEHAEITWRNENEILLGMAPILRSYLAELKFENNF